MSKAEHIQIEMDTKDSSSSDDGIGVGAGKNHKSKCSASKKTTATTSKSTKPPLKKIDENWPKDIPREDDECIKDCDKILREAIHQGRLIALTRYLEALLAIERDVKVELSAQHLINHIKNKGKKTGEVTKYNEIRDFLRSVGLVPECFCPYVGRIDETCPKTCQKCEVPGYKIRDLIYTKGKHVKEEELIKIVKDAPVVAVIEVYPSFYKHKEGVYEGPTERELRKPPVRHVVLVSGYGSTPDGVHYWKILNSWGTGWGEKGFGKIRRKCSNGDKPSLFIKVIRLVLEDLNEDLA